MLTRKPRRSGAALSNAGRLEVASPDGHQAARLAAGTTSGAPYVPCGRGQLAQGKGRGNASPRCTARPSRHRLRGQEQDRAKVQGLGRAAGADPSPSPSPNLSAGSSPSPSPSTSTSTSTSTSPHPHLGRAAGAAREARRGLRRLLPLPLYGGRSGEQASQVHVRRGRDPSPSPPLRSI